MAWCKDGNQGNVLTPQKAGDICLFVRWRMKKLLHSCNNHAKVSTLHTRRSDLGEALLARSAGQQCGSPKSPLSGLPLFLDSARAVSSQP
jgi:hypothetical protein